ncbi:MAG: 5-formyltetrahydrofolate cyclo-ligase [Butyrivibrio sp.]|nr:5-formyltetrahydrofolate cyclo-ligase [Acetatifactor muris]MCM1560526.1 5-formyltetrahydrofolate cyclo-ligase [Butyrivibrio sp.]
MDKGEIRRQALSLREGVSAAERERARILLTERIMGHQWFYRSDTLLGFAGCGSEIDTEELLREALRLGKKVYLPRVTEPSEGRMAFLRIERWEDLKPGYGGIPEPDAGAEAYEYHERDAEHVLMLMPGVAFDPYRNRIGYGRGFYDRYLADKPALQLRTIGVGFKCQMVEEMIPCGEHDVRPCQVICI